MPEPTDPATARYIRTVCTLPQLDKPAELELARRYRDTRDPACMRRLVEANLRHVVALALRYRRLGVPLDELIAQGNLGLMSSLERFDPERGLRVATYANHWIRAELIAYALRTRAGIGSGRGERRARYAFVSLDAPIADDTTTTLHDRLADDAPEYEERHARAAAAPELASALATATAGLGERERFIVAHRLLADVEARLTLEEIGKHFGFTRERARQLELRLKTSLRERLSAVVERHALSSAA